MGVGAELTYNSNVTALQMANTIFGDGVSVLSASYSGPSYSAAIYSDGQLSPGVVPSNSGVILSTGRADSFTQHNGNPNRSTGTSTDTTGTNNNAQFNAVAGAPTYDAVWLDATFVPTGNTMTIKFVFASEEYPEYINSQFNDVVGVWVNGSAVPISVGTGRTSVNNINTNTQPNLTVSNVNDTYNTEMDGFTVTLSLDMQVTPGVANTIRIGIADVSDAQYDSNLLIAADSVQTAVVARDDSVTMFATGTQTINVLGNDQSASGNALVITQINGVPVVAGQTVVLPSGQQIRLNADGTFTITGDGQTENTSFTYTVSNAHGNGNGVTDTAIVNLTQIPCFVAGTLIGTPGGPRRVEGLTLGIWC
ncbi:choice-of-anchor L domain-containing protein [Gemmobacter lanyuensis]